MAIKFLMRGGIYLIFIMAVVAGWLLRKRRPPTPDHNLPDATSKISLNNRRLTHWQARLQVVEQLANLQDAQAALPQLAKMLNDPDSDVRDAVVSVMAGYGAAALTYLTDILENGSLNSRMAAASAMGLSADTAAVPSLDIALHDESAWVRLRAAEALGIIHDPQGIASLQNALQVEADEDVRTVMRDALRTLGADSSMYRTGNPD
jgi:HEAT repeat protein